MEELINYKIENLAITKLETYTKVHNRFEYYNIEEEKVFKIEDDLSIKKKLEIIDAMTEGLGSYILELILKYETAKNEKAIKMTQYGGFNKNSLNKWIKENDPRKICYISYDSSFPRYKFEGNLYKLESITPRTDYSYKRLYDGKDIIHQLFHDLLINRYKDEIEYYRNNDPIQIKMNKVRDLANKYNIYPENNEKLSNLIFNNKREGISAEEINAYLNILNDLEKQIEYTYHKLEIAGNYYKEK